ncbi:MAG: hypothetical protein IBJ13_11725 [Sphingopyxis sp.]|nr:hypothetical protein [Sphingopyxis sp.]
MRVAIFLLLLAMALGYAAWKGGGPERSMAALLVTMAVADQALHLFIPAKYGMVDIGHFAIDLFAAAATILLALAAHRFWPMMAAVLQTLPLLGHFSRAIDISMHPAAYMTMQVAASWLLPPLLVLATWRHQQRLKRNGSDRSWRNFWHRSTRSMPSA